MDSRNDGAIAGARCALHPEQPARIVCQRCGNFACERCVSHDDPSGLLCLQCKRPAVAAVNHGRYHVVLPGRFVFFMLLTFGTYALYWFWKNWKQIKRQDGDDSWPIARTFFAGIMYFELLRDINTQLAMNGSQRRLSGWLGAGFLVSNLLHRLPDPYDLLSLFAGFFMLPAVLAIRDLASPAALENARWQRRHTLLAIGCVVFYCVLIAVYALTDDDLLLEE